MKKIIRLIWLPFILLYTIVPLFYKNKKLVENYEYLFIISAGLIVLSGLVITGYIFVFLLRSKFKNRLWKAIWFLIISFFPSIFPYPFAYLGMLIFYIIVVELKSTISKN